MNLSPRAGKPAQASDLVDLSKLLTAYFEQRPDPAQPEQRVIFGTSGHRGSSLRKSFNEWHILAITQAICLYRKQLGIDGPLFLGIDTHALSQPALASALEVLAANQVHVMLAARDDYTPTPVVSHAILAYNNGRTQGLSDGIVITPSHNPPEWGGFKYNPPHGGPAAETVTDWIEQQANGFLIKRLVGIKRIPVARALAASTTHKHDYQTAYIEDLQNVIDMESVSGSSLRLGVDPLGGAGVHYWARIAERYQLDLKVVNERVDPTFKFMTLDWDGQIRMDPSSVYAMQTLVALKDQFDLSFACDTDHDRHGVVTRSRGLLPPNHYLAACVQYLFTHRPRWNDKVAVGKTVVTSSMLDKVAKNLTRKLYEVPVGFKYFVAGLGSGQLGFAGEESAGCSFLRLDGTVWTTDKDGMTAALLAAEMTARGNDPGQIYQELVEDFGNCCYGRTEAAATMVQKKAISKLAAVDLKAANLAGEKILSILTTAPGDGNPIGGIRVSTQQSWFAARPSGTEPIYKIYAESFAGPEQLAKIQTEAQAMVSEALRPGAQKEEAVH